MLRRPLRPVRVAFFEREPDILRQQRLDRPLVWASRMRSPAANMPVFGSPGVISIGGFALPERRFGRNRGAVSGNAILKLLADDRGGPLNHRPAKLSASWAGSANFVSCDLPNLDSGQRNRVSRPNSSLTDSNSMMIGYPSPPNSRVARCRTESQRPQRREPYQYERSNKDILTRGLHDALPNPAAVAARR